MLSGQELLSKGLKKNEVTLPIIGIKDTTPNNSWLEKQQIQSALESRKQLVEAQRIEKSGVLCHAVWQENLKLAEVTKQTGNHWNFLGQAQGTKIYLKPEEALFLIEINSLLLTYNDVIVTLQQAYSLLLRDAVSKKKYKVYSSLSRLGYKVFPHINSSSVAKNEKVSKECSTEKIETTPIADSEKNYTELESICCDTTTCKSLEKISEENNESLQLNICQDTENEKDMQIDFSQSDNNSDTVSKEQSPKENANNNKIKTKNPFTLFCEEKLQVLKSRHLIKTYDGIHKSFENIPDFSPSSCTSAYIQIETPKNEYLPMNIPLNEMTHLLNVKNISSRNNQPSMSNDITYNASDEVNEDHIRRVTTSNSIPELINIRTTPFYRNIRSNTPYQCWRQPSQNAFCFSQGVFLYQVPLASLNQPRFHFYPRTHIPIAPRYFMNVPNMHSNLLHTQLQQQTNNNSTRKRKRNNRKRTNNRKRHLESIESIAARFRHLVSAGSVQAHNKEALQRLIQTYNSRYKENLELNDNYEIIANETTFETIELEDDEAPKPKKVRNSNLQYTYLNKIQKLADKLNQLECEGKSSAIHKRAFSKLIKTFNKSYNAEIYLNGNHEVLDKRSITLDSSSDSDCIIEDISEISSGKKYQNPFHILKRLTERENASLTLTTNIHQVENGSKESEASLSKAKPSHDLKRIFSKFWLPNLNDFGKPEIVSGEDINYHILESTKEEFLYELMQNKAYDFQNWTEVKIEFLEIIKDTNETLRKEALKSNNVIRSLISKEDCTNMASVLDKICIVKKNNSITNECSLTIDFDVYNRDVQNFRKSDRPKPNFRIVCLDESSKCPTGNEVASLHSKYKDKVMIVFAFIGFESISYLEINPVEVSL